MLQAEPTRGAAWSWWGDDADGVMLLTGLQSSPGGRTSKREGEQEQGGLGSTAGPYLNQLVRVIMT